MNLGIVQTIWNAFSDLVTSIVDINIIFYVGVGFLLLMSIFFFVRARSSYEYKLEKASDRLNDWLFKHQNITEQNLVEFNNIMKEKRTPKILRKYWQQYMLYRDKAPSEYMSTYNCIDKPLKTSSFTSNIKNFTMIYVVTAVVTFFLSMFTFASSTKTDTLLTYITQSMVASIVILFIGVVLTLALRAMQNYNIATLYQTFNVFNRYIDKASTTIPKYVDFEILFTKQEIKDGIPILGEYLEKRARQEQEELEEAQKNAVSHEEYDFSQSGVDGALVLERAMKESETYINIKQRLLAEIQQFESEISTLKKNYENTSKDYQRKLQASKENMERLRQQQEESTNRIEVNYIRKQQQDEVKKQEQLEKDQEDATNKFNAEVNSLNAEIEDRRTQLEAKRAGVQEAMQNEYQTFSSKLHKAISNNLEESKNETIQQVVNEKDKYAQAITYLKNEVDSRDELIKAKDQTIAELATKLQDYLAGKITAEALVAETEQHLKATETAETAEDASADGHYDDNGYYWFNNGTYYDNQNQYHDLEGNVFDENGNLLMSGQPVEKEAKVAMVEPVAQETVAQPAVEEVQPQEEPSAQPQTVQEPQAVAQESQVQAEPAKLQDGNYDDKGNYVYANGTYYDANNLYHADGKVYNTEGTLLGEDDQKEEPAKAEANAQPAVEPAKPEQEVAKPAEPAQVAEKEESKEEASAEPKRGRGRPKKEQTDKTQDKPKRAVGRPKKQPTDAPTPTKRKAGRPKKEDVEEQPVERRKAGRPKKEQTATTAKATEPKRAVGRPKKSANAETAEPATKRKVGRPKKDDDSKTTQIKRKNNRIIIDLN